MNLTLELHDKYEEKLAQAESIDPVVRDRLIASLESDAMERIIEVAAQAEQAKQEQASVSVDVDD